jgi:predicted dithiol-disulfide oxidoreductase (DUF899 family)
MPEVVDRATFQADLDRLRAQEKAHTHEGDGIAAARRRLPMVELDPAIPLSGPDGPVTLLEAFEGRRQLIAYYFMWHAGRPAAEQCEGCTFYNGQIGELSSLDGDRVFETYWTTRRGAEAMDYSYALMDLTVYGRQETWEDSPPGWPQQCSNTRTDGGSPAWPLVPAWPGGRPIAQWPRLEAGRSDDLGTASR